ncbi:uncharacterized protein TM35_000112120 [Trypanosoma theileri]|uniref:Leishmanolysin-like peptidase n=1 Tax=Trypanosoma theileri TaxID=67003 RepID=A0A1X0NYP7_9TRYP|nr:uncharacterized protein TM35_000112120 [Trypanosoma theileri]ORC89678.1 hypothetical protein TM35_000112120 [Trypanosoma theileri]
MFVLLLLLLLFLCCASVCIAQKDGGDAPSTGVVRELPRKGRSGVQAYTVATSKRQLIRIKTSMEDLKKKTKYCTKKKDTSGECEDPDNCNKDHFGLTMGCLS